MKMELNFNEFKGLSQISENQILIDSTAKTFELEQAGNQLLMRLEHKTYALYDVHFAEGTLQFRIQGERYLVGIRDEQALLLEKMGFKSGTRKNQGILKSPMPGKIIALRKAVGDVVKSGEPVIILEAMKMENELKAPSDGTIKAIMVSEGQSVEKNIPLLEIV
jgi:biotin carboxyl carrier protein